MPAACVALLGGLVSEMSNPSLDCLMPGHLIVEACSADAAQPHGVVAAWCLWCGQAVYDAEGAGSGVEGASVMKVSRQQFIEAMATELAEQDGFVVVNEATRKSYEPRAERLMELVEGCSCDCGCGK
jgi:hypothetical protein